LNDPLLKRLLRRFEDHFDPDLPGLAEPGPTDSAHPLAWFPAWLLTEQPALGHNRTLVIRSQFPELARLG
jgi:hypothetical protein